VRAVNLASTFCQLSSAQFMISRFGLFSRLSRFGRLQLAISCQPEIPQPAMSPSRRVSVSPHQSFCFFKSEIRNPQSKAVAFYNPSGYISIAI
jgi:hypothetical protein